MLSWHLPAVWLEQSKPKEISLQVKEAMIRLKKQNKSKTLGIAKSSICYIIDIKGCSDDFIPIKTPVRPWKTAKVNDHRILSLVMKTPHNMEVTFMNRKVTLVFARKHLKKGLLKWYSLERWNQNKLGSDWWEVTEKNSWWSKTTTSCAKYGRSVEMDSLLFIDDLTADRTIRMNSVDNMLTFCQLLQKR